MAEQQATTPTEVAQPSIDDKIAARFGLTDEPQSPPEQEQAPTEEPATEDVPAVEGEEEIPPVEEEVPTADVWELKHNGQIKKVSKEEAVNLAQKGFDYETKMAEQKETRQRLEGMANAIKASQDLTQPLVEAAADIRSFQRELQKFGSVDWVKESTDDPIGAFQKRQQFDTLVQGYNEAMARYNSVATQKQQVGEQIDRAVAAEEAKVLSDKLPKWKDPKVYEKDWADITKLFTDTLKPSTVERLIPAIYADHGISVLLYKALKYDAAIAAMQSKKGAQAPAVPKPGVPSMKMTRGEVVGERIKQLHQAKDPQRKKALFDEVLAAKFGLK